MSVKPPAPNSGTSLPVFASSAMSRESDETTMRGAVFASPGQYARPRRVVPSASNFQIGVPASGFSAKTPFWADTYSTPLTTSGVLSKNPLLSPVWNVHARSSV